MRLLLLDETFILPYPQVARCCWMQCINSLPSKFAILKHTAQEKNMRVLHTHFTDVWRQSQAVNVQCCLTFLDERVTIARSYLQTRHFLWHMEPPLNPISLIQLLRLLLPAAWQSSFPAHIVQLIAFLSRPDYNCRIWRLLWLQRRTRKQNEYSMNAMR